jgi:hypothetical protein
VSDAGKGVEYRENLQANENGDHKKSKENVVSVLFTCTVILLPKLGLLGRRDVVML